MPRLLLECDQAELIAPALLQELLHRVDPGTVSTYDGDASLAERRMAVDLLDVGIAAEVVGAVDHPVDLAEHLDGVGLEVEGLPVAAALDLLLAYEQVVQSLLGLA